MRNSPYVYKTLRHEIVHLLASILLALAIFYFSGDNALALFAFALSFLLDVDHLVDYFLYLFKFGKRFSLSEFLSGGYFDEWGKFITPFHSWELCIINLLFYFWFGNLVFVVIFLSLAVHYILDHIMNDVNVYAYFLAFRLRHNFVKTFIKP